MKKSELTRRMNLLAGTRPTLPGHHNTREANLRTELAECFEPVNTMELLWVADIAYCTAAIEYYRVQIAGFRIYKFRKALKDELEKDDMPDFPGFNRLSMYSPEEQAGLARFAAQNFEASRDEDMLAETHFAMMLGTMTGYELQQLRSLQQLLHDETRERDRLVNQIDRRRRQAMRDAIEIAEANERAFQYEEQRKSRKDREHNAVGADNAAAMADCAASDTAEAAVLEDKAG